MRQICLVARHLAPVVDEFRAVLGLEVCHRDPGVGKYGLENALFPIGHNFLEVVAPVREGTTAGRYLDRRGGDGGYMVITQCEDLAPRRKRCEAVGVRIAHEIGHPEYRELQLHPRDVGAAMLSFGWQPGAREPGGPWHPAAWRGAAEGEPTRNAWRAAGARSSSARSRGAMGSASSPSTTRRSASPRPPMGGPRGWVASTWPAPIRRAPASSRSAASASASSARNPPQVAVSRGHRTARCQRAARIRHIARFRPS